MTQTTTDARAQQCDGCRFWQRLDAGNLYAYEEDIVLPEGGGDPELGHCRRYPPQFDGVQNAAYNARRQQQSGYGNSDALNVAAAYASTFPMTWYYDWCGEWSADAASSQRGDVNR